MAGRRKEVVLPLKPHFFKKGGQKETVEWILTGQSLLQPPEQGGLLFAGQFMLPNPQDTPAGFPQGFSHQPVTGLIVGDLFAPEGGVALGLGAMLGAAVPETTVNIDREPHLPEYKIRFAEDFRLSPPAG